MFTAVPVLVFLVPPGTGKKLISLQVSPTCQVVMAGGPQVHTDHLAHLTFLNIPLRRCINTARLTEGSGVFILDIRPADFGQF